MNVFLSVVGCSPKHFGWKSRRAWRQRRKRGKIWCPFSSCCSDTNAKVRYMNYWMTTTTTLTSISYTATSTFASIICSPTGFTHVTCPSGWRGQRKNLLLCLMFGSGFVFLKNMCTVLRTLHIVFVCVRNSFAVVRIYQDDFEKVSIKPLGLNKSSETSILHSIGNLSFERRKQFLRKSFTKLWLRSLETWQDISIYGQQGKKTKNQLKWFMMNHYIYRRFLQKRNDNNTAVPVINSQSQTSLISFLHWAIWIEAQWTKNVSQNYHKY